MPIASVKLRPGVDEIKSALYNEAGIATSNLIRFAPTASQDALVQKMGGWVKYHPDAFTSTVRALHSWADLNGSVYLAVGAESQLAALVGTTRQDISARRDRQTALGTLDFSTTNGSTEITVGDIGRNLADSDVVNIRTPITVGGVTLQGLYPITATVGTDAYKIQAATPATATVASGGALPSFATLSGTTQITVTFNNHGLSPGDYVSFPLATTVGGVTIQGDYIVLTTPTANSYTFAASQNATSTTSATMNGGAWAADYYIGLGPLPLGTGYGIGAYGDGTYGRGVAPTSVNTGSVITTTDWTLGNFGELLISCPKAGPIFQWGPRGTTSNAAILDAAPVINEGVFIAMPQRQAIAYGSTFTQVQDPLLIRWCHIEDLGVWVGTSTNQAGSYRLSSGSRIVGGMQGPGQGLIWTDTGLWTMQYIGAPLVYGFKEVATGCGLIAKKAAGILGNQVFWMSQKQFYRMSGDGVQPMPCPVWDVVFQNLKAAYVDKVRCCVNSQFNEIMWFFPSNNSTGENDMYVKYNALLGVWDYGSLGRTAWIDQSVLGSPIGAGANGYIYQHEVGYDDDGQPINAYFETGYYSISEGQDKIFVDRIWPDMAFGPYPGPDSAQVQISFECVDYPTDSPRTFGPYTMTSARNFISTRLRSRLVRLKVESNDVGSFWRLGLLRYRFQQDGRFA